LGGFANQLIQKWFPHCKLQNIVQCHGPWPVVTVTPWETARVWDAPTTRNQDEPSDVLLLADLAEAACGSVLEASGQAEILHILDPKKVRQQRENRREVSRSNFTIDFASAILEVDCLGPEKSNYLPLLRSYTR
jgi:hypothetical protein